MYIKECVFVHIMYDAWYSPLGQYGIPRPWYFPFTKSYWCGEKQGKNIQERKEGNAEGRFKKENLLTPLFLEMDLTLLFFYWAILI